MSDLKWMFSRPLDDLVAPPEDNDADDEIVHEFIVPFDPMDDDDDPPTLRLEDLANAPADAPHSSEFGNVDPESDK